MSYLYLWKSTRLSPTEAAEQFTTTLGKQAARLEESFGRRFHIHTHQLGTLFIGQINFLAGIKGWHGWQESERSGVAWSGVCESLLGAQPRAETLERFVAALASNPKQAGTWSGRFAACTWDQNAGRATLTTSPEDSPTLWYTEGPHGWAAGSRAQPLVELVQRPAEIDLQAAGVFLAYGYLAGQNSLLRHVRRIGSRQHIVVSAERVEQHTYISLPEYLALDQQPRGWNELVQEQAEQLLARVRCQIEHSEHPQILLTGGRDSRCIAAAAVASGYNGTARTSGPSGMDDVKIAAQVAGVLGIAHERENAEQERAPMRAFVENDDRVQLWAQLNEGIETFRHAVSFQPFFQRELPYPARYEHVFHGLHGLAGDSLRQRMFNNRGAPASDPIDWNAARAAVHMQIPPHLRTGIDVRGAIDESLDQLHRELGAMPLQIGQWCTLFYWQNRALQWGEDSMSAKDTIAWHWTPLLNGTLARAYFNGRGRTGKQFLEDITVAIAPRLGAVPYDKQPATPWSDLKKRVKTTLKVVQRFGITMPNSANKAKIPIDQHLLAFWDQTLFRSSSRVWPELVDEQLVRELTETKPSSEILWNLATIELAAHALLERDLASSTSVR